MFLSKLEIKNFRNILKASFFFNKKINIFIGENAQGKTNILESIYFLSITKSHRTNNEINLINDLKWEYEYDNPVDINDIIGTFIENNDKYQINMWISLDKNVYINVTEHNADKIIRYIYERFPM